MNEMINPVVRLSSLTLENIKNVRKGTVCVPMAGITKAGVLGIYGQNGSGKTTVIDALYFLQQIMMGNGLEPAIADYMNSESDLMLKSLLNLSYPATKTLSMK